MGSVLNKYSRVYWMMIGGERNMSENTSVGYNTANIRGASSAMDEATQDFLNKYRMLQETVNNAAITGPVKAALEAKLEEKRPIFEAVQKAMNEGADYTARQAVEGDRLADELQSGML